MRAGLFRPEEFRDNCSFGLIAHMQGEASHHLLQTAIQSLTCMTHRGGSNADGKTGHGCGQAEKESEACKRLSDRQPFDAELPDLYAVGMVFLDQDPIKAEAARACFNEQILAQGLTLVGWREVPVDTSVLGRLALERLPRIEQLFVCAEGLSEREFGIKLFMSRRRTEVALADDKQF